MAISTRARTCALILVCGVGSLLTGCALESESGDETASVAEALAVDTAIYSNSSLSAPWQSWGWSSSVSFGNTDAPLRASSTSQIKTTIQNAWGALSLAHAPGDLDVADYDAVTFDIRSTTSSNVRVSLQTLGGASSGTAQTIPLTSSWTTQTLRLDGLKGGLSKFGKVNVVGPQAGQTFYVDNLRLVPKTAAAPAPAPTPTPTPTPAPTSSSFPSSPLAVTKSTVVTMNSGASPYFLYVPASYDASHNTPTKLLVWMHGCGGDGRWDAQVVSPGGSQSWLTISIGGRDGACWNISTDTTLVLAALDDVKRRLNVDPRRVVIGGYSSGGNLAYRTAFANAGRFAGLIAENTGTLYGAGPAYASAAWKLNVVHLAHLSDTTFPISTVRSETDTLKAAGFPTTRLERPGTHWDNDTATTGTNYDLRALVLPYLDAGWTSPP